MAYSQVSLATVAFIAALAVLVAVSRNRRRRSIKAIRGPPSPSWLLGNELQISMQKDAGDLDFQWMRQYGAVWRTQRCYGEDNLYLADPKALQYILQTSAYYYPKKISENFVNKLMMGRGLVSAIGDAHRRQRKVMNPAFSATQLRSFLPYFDQTASILTQKWKDILESSAAQETEINVCSWLARTTMDIIGDVAFDYRFGALEDKENVLVKAFKNFFVQASLHTPQFDLLFKALWKYIPSNLLDFLQYMPTRQDAYRRRYLKLAKDIARDLVEQKKSASVEERSKDILNILVWSNMSEDPKSQMDDDEVFSQVATFILAGHETTASTVGWMLYELARHQDIQTKLREEIAQFRQKIIGRGDIDFTAVDLEAMPFMNAIIKETYRYHNIVQAFNRYADRDDVIPLAYPITTQSGSKISEIPVNKGQAITVSICAYNRLPEVWGADAHEWNPNRFLDIKENRQTSVGVYANLLTFSAGVRACIGWRFALIETQALLVKLVENFHFAPPARGVRIIRAPAQVMLPLVEGRQSEGMQMPLRVSLAK